MAMVVIIVGLKKGNMIFMTVWHVKIVSSIAALALWARLLLSINNFPETRQADRRSNSRLLQGWVSSCLVSVHGDNNELLSEDCCYYHTQELLRLTNLPWSLIIIGVASRCC